MFGNSTFGERTFGEIAAADGAQLSAAAVATAVISASFSGSSAQLSAAATAIAFASGALTTGIALASAVLAQASASGNFAGQGAALTANVVAGASASGALSASVSLAASVLATASGQTTLTTLIALTAIAQAQGSATGLLTGGGLIITAEQFSRDRDRKRVRLLIKGLNFSPKRAAEKEIFAVDYAHLLAPGETISSPAWSISAVVGEDDDASSMLIGQAAFDGTIAAHIIAGGVPGVEYAPVCTVQTSLGQTLALPEVDEGHLYISQ